MNWKELIFICFLAFGAYILLYLPQADEISSLRKQVSNLRFDMEKLDRKYEHAEKTIREAIANLKEQLEAMEFVSVSNVVLTVLNRVRCAFSPIQLGC